MPWTLTSLYFSAVQLLSNSQSTRCCSSSVNNILPSNSKTFNLLVVRAPTTKSPSTNLLFLQTMDSDQSRCEEFDILWIDPEAFDLQIDQEAQDGSPTSRTKQESPEPPEDLSQSMYTLLQTYDEKIPTMDCAAEESGEVSLSHDLSEPVY
jgi:hypothetical protein